jgi:hypothetical protein
VNEESKPESQDPSVSVRIEPIEKPTGFSISGSRRLPGIDPRRQWLQPISLAMSIVMAGSSLAAPAGVQLVPSDNQLTSQKVADRLEKLFPALDAADRELPRDTFDPQAVLEKVGREPKTLFGWVRDETYLVPYRGVLRGATGVLMDRVGNSLDRALLLSSLLRSAGQQVRLAHGTLSKEQAQHVLQERRSIPHGGVPPAPQSSPEQADKLVEKYSEQYGLDAKELHGIREKNSSEGARMAKEVTQRVAQQSSTIISKVGKPVAADSGSAEDKALEALRDHWWVQRQEGDKWLDMDPSLPDAEPGQFLTDAHNLIQIDKVDESLWHQVEVRVLIEQWSDGHLAERQALTHIFKPAELLGKSIVLHQYPLNWSNGESLLDGNDPTPRIKTGALAQREWLPVLSVGDNDIAQSSFTDSGDLKEKPGADATAGAYTGAAGAFGRAFGGGNSQSTPKPEDASTPSDTTLAKKYFTAAWIEYEIRSPGQQVRTIRREIFDLLGPASRGKTTAPEPKITEAQRLERALALLGQTEILPLSCQLSPEFVQHLTATGMLANREILLGALRKGDGSTAKDLATEIDKATPLPGPLYALALARRMWSRFRGDIYQDSPNVFSYHVMMRQNQHGELVLCQGFDIVANDVAVPVGSKADPFLVRIEQGVVDTNAEALIMGGCGKVENTAELFSMGGGKGENWVTIRSQSDPAWQSVELPMDVRARIEKDLATGYVVMVPKKPITVEDRGLIGWWRVNPTTGQTLGMGQRGWGTADEDAALRAKAIEDAIRGARAIGKVILGILCMVKWKAKIKELGLGASAAVLMGCGLGTLGLGALGALATGVTGQIASLISDLVGLILTGLGFLM